MYCTYEQYRAAGGSMTAEEFAVWGPRASRMMDRMTMGRIKRRTADLPEEVADAVADACAQIADALKEQGRIRRSSGSGGRASANTDGYSESYASAAEAEAGIRQTVYSILSAALGDDPYNLLYLGVGECY